MTVDRTPQVEFLSACGEDHFVIDRAKAEENTKFDGVLVLRTNTDLDPSQTMQAPRYFIVPVQERKTDLIVSTDVAKLEISSRIA
jgi:hypothetical protein